MALCKCRKLVSYEVNHESLLDLELENHLGIKDKVLSEFIIDLSKSSENSDDFRKDLTKNGAEMTETLVERIWNLIQHMQVWQYIKNFCLFALYIPHRYTLQPSALSA